MPRQQRQQIMSVIQGDDGYVNVTFANGGVTRMSGQVWMARCLTIKHGMEWEIRFPGSKLTSRAPSTFTIARQEFGIGGRDKRAAYLRFCELTGQGARQELIATDPKVAP
jgi:hypothetical protein